jgi:hypothetical protein
VLAVKLPNALIVRSDPTRRCITGYVIYASESAKRFVRKLTKAAGSHSCFNVLSLDSPAKTVKDNKESDSA